MVTLVAQHAHQLGGQGIVEQLNDVLAPRPVVGRHGALVQAASCSVDSPASSSTMRSGSATGSCFTLLGSLVATMACSGGLSGALAHQPDRRRLGAPRRAVCAAAHGAPLPLPLPAWLRVG